MRTHGAAARRGKSVGLARLRILGRPTASSASQPTSGPEKKKQDNKKGSSRKSVERGLDF